MGGSLSTGGIDTGLPTGGTQGLGGIAPVYGVITSPVVN